MNGQSDYFQRNANFHLERRLLPPEGRGEPEELEQDGVALEERALLRDDLLAPLAERGDREQRRPVCDRLAGQGELDRLQQRRDRGVVAEVRARDRVDVRAGDQVQAARGRRVREGRREEGEQFNR